MVRFACIDLHEYVCTCIHDAYTAGMAGALLGGVGGMVVYVCISGVRWHAVLLAA